MDIQIYRQQVKVSLDGIELPQTPEVNIFLDALKKTDIKELVYVPDVPTRGSKEAAGFDVKAFLPPIKHAGYVDMLPGETVMIPTGLFVAPEELSVILVCSRSGLATKGVFVTNGPGVVDSDYRGEIKVILTYIAPFSVTTPFRINHGDKIAQLLFLSPAKVNIADVTFTDVMAVHDDKGWAVPQLRETDRGAGGFGSTGK